VVLDFVERVRALIEVKDSILCVGLDCALPRQRDRDTIPKRYLEISDENEARLNFCLDVAQEVKDYCVAVKPNQQYVIGFTKHQHRRLTDAARSNQMVSILDYKLNDIGDTIESGIFHLTECGYDAITFNPLPGNLEETVRLAHGFARRLRGYGIGIIVLTLMSNPEATKYMKDATLGGKPLYLAIAEDVRRYDADGCVVGATGHVTDYDIRRIRLEVGDERLLLIPGVGSQRGDPQKVIKAGGKNILINVGRDIIYSGKAKEKAREYQVLFNETRGMNRGKIK
jgi:orotidine-5'-phosphate decarboxylase